MLLQGDSEEQEEMLSLARLCAYLFMSSPETCASPPAFLDNLPTV